MVKIEKQRLSEKEGYYFHNCEPAPWVVEIMEKVYTQGLEDCCKIQEGDK